MSLIKKEIDPSWESDKKEQNTTTAIVAMSDRFWICEQTKHLCAPKMTENCQFFSAVSNLNNESG